MTKIALDLIERGDRLRARSPEQVAALAASMTEVGLIQPITVYARDVIRAGIAVPGYGLVAGLHRLEAAQSLEWTHIAAHVVTLDDLQRQLAECDENLCGTKLTKAERALFTRRRQEIYEAIHPEARAQVRQGHIRQGVADDNLSPAFTADTARRTGVDPRTVQRDAMRGERIPEAILAEVKGTDLDRGVHLDALARASDPAAELRRLRAEKDAEEARKANRETDRLIAEGRIHNLTEWLAARLDVTELHDLGEMLRGVCDPLSRALIREAA